MLAADDPLPKLLQVIAFDMFANVLVFPESLKKYLILFSLLDVQVDRMLFQLINFSALLCKISARYHKLQKYYVK